jgi:hypothetical protein
MRILMIVRYWHDGDLVSWTWNWWNPASWVAAVIVFIGGLVMYGASIFTRDDLSDLGFCLSTYWKERKNERVFLPPLGKTNHG